MDYQQLLETDRQYIWHPYSALGSDLPLFPVASASGVRLKLSDGRELIDGMSSWWCVIHGYNHPHLNLAVSQQLNQVAHVMFGGLTHQPAVELAEKLVSITPSGLDAVFFADSGSVSVEVAMKMAIQYWQSLGHSQKQHFASLRHGYHGDTFGAMSVCDPVTGMHSLFNQVLSKQYFIPAPQSRYGEACSTTDLTNLEIVLKEHHQHLAALILEPIVQGAGGMWFYSSEYLNHARRLCDEYDVLLIADEIATGFGRSGELFACNHAGITPDIMCIGKALTGGYMTLAATLTSKTIANTINQGEPGVFMHGPTFMANPLACAVANASIELLLDSDWQDNIRRIEQGLKLGLQQCKQLEGVADVRILGAIGVVEMKQAVDMNSLVPKFVESGIWVRPFGKLVYLMPPYIISDEDLAYLTQSLSKVLKTL